LESGESHGLYPDTLVRILESLYEDPSAPFTPMEISVTGSKQELESYKAACSLHFCLTYSLQLQLP